MIDEKLKIIYIVGCSRSGSTILDSILGTHENVVGLGELEKLHEFGWCGSDYCGCGSRVRECGFWSAVRKRWSAEGDSPAYQRMQDRYSRVRQTPRLILSGSLPGSDFSTYERLTAVLYRAIATEAGVDVLVDSSKNPMRAMALSRMKNIDLRLVHLVRDPRGVAVSLMKSWSKDPEAGIQQDMQALQAKDVARGWNLANRFSDWLVGRASPASVRIKYEELLENPVETLTSIGEVASLDFDPVASHIRLGKPIHIGHTVAGNRLRMQSSVVLKKQDEWPERISPEIVQEINRRCSRGMRRYGYDAVIQ